MSANLDDAVDATVKRLTALDEADRQLERRRAAIQALSRDEKMPRSHIFLTLNTALRERGLTDEQMSRAGVSYDSISATLKRR